MDVDPETVPPRPCKTCNVGVLSAYDPVRFKNCARCRAQNRNPSSIATSREGTKKSAKKLQNYELNAKQAAARLAPGNSGEGGSSEKRKKASKRRPQVKVFPSTSEMYDALTKKVLNSVFDGCGFLEFHGTVDKAVRFFDHEERVSLITVELADCAQLQFNEECELDTEIGDSSYSTTYPCRCRLSLEDCHGKVKVTAESNGFYAGGIPREKTTVRVYHG